MSEMFRHCPDCGEEQLFTQHHAGSCPDAADGECPEWSCSGCGTALLAGFVLYRAESGYHAVLRGRVA